jgi:tetratricopeptide (TPR) repeat protein
LNSINALCKKVPFYELLKDKEMALTIFPNSSSNAERIIFSFSTDKALVHLSLVNKTAGNILTNDFFKELFNNRSSLVTRHESNQPNFINRVRNNYPDSYWKYACYYFPQTRKTANIIPLNLLPKADRSGVDPNSSTKTEAISLLKTTTIFPNSSPVPEGIIAFSDNEALPNLPNTHQKDLAIESLEPSGESSEPREESLGSSEPLRPFESLNWAFISETLEMVEIHTQNLEMNPLEISNRCGRAQSFYFLGKTYEALEDYNFVLAGDPENEQAQQGIKDCRLVDSNATQIDIESSKLSEYMRSLKQKLEEDPKDISTRLHRAAIRHILQGKKNEALEDYNFILETEPGKIQARIIRPRILSELGRSNEALEDYNFILKEFPQDLEHLQAHGLAWINRAKILHERGENN